MMLIAEVLSESTEAFDGEDKFHHCQPLESLTEYVLIARDTQPVECRRPTTDNTWQSVVHEDDNRVELTSLGIEFDIAELYRGLDG